MINLKMRTFFYLGLFALLFSSVLASGVDEKAAEVSEDKHTEEAFANILYNSPNVSGHVYFAEHFDNPEAVEERWVKSQAKKEGSDESIAKYDGEWQVEAAMKEPMKGDLGLVIKSKGRHSAISAFLDKPFHFDDKPLIVQYEVKIQNGQECGGAYLKLLQYEEGMKLTEFTDKTPYSIMFGPDNCGVDYKLHFIFQHKNPNNGTLTEKHAKLPSSISEYFTDKEAHLYRLALYPNNTFEISVDHKIVKKGSLLEDMVPPVNPPAEIEDPEDVMPIDWDEREKIRDPTAQKPENWDDGLEIVDTNAVKPSGWLENEEVWIPDPEAKMPDDWDEEMDGKWEVPSIENPVCKSAPGCGKWTPPMIKNPMYKGEWRAPLIDNPNYKGKWQPRKIPNPDYFHDPNPFKMIPIGAVGFELWSVSNNILFDNIVITDDKVVADEWAASTFDIKPKSVNTEKDRSESATLLDKVISYGYENPITSGACTAVGLVAVIFVLLRCLSGGDRNDAKKTDDVTPDDESPEEKNETKEEPKEEDEDEPKEEDEDEPKDKDEEETKEDKPRAKLLPEVNEEKPEEDEVVEFLNTNKNRR